MASYRFCRSDDWALLAAAHETCVRPHAADLPPLGVEQLKLAAREIGLWAGNCMVATEGGAPIGVLLAAKRESEVLVWRLGVRPDRLRRGHGRHLLTSLADKLRILGPRRLVVEVPEPAAAARALLESAGHVREGEWVDFIAPGGGTAAVSSDLVARVTVDDLAPSFDPAIARAWDRALPTLLARRAHLQGLAVASAERIEAHVLWENLASERRILALGCADRERTGVWLKLLLEHLAPGAPQVRLHRAGAAELPFERIEALGFLRRDVTLRYAKSVDRASA